MLIATGNHQDIVASHTMIACKCICWQVGTYNLSNMGRAFCVRPCDTYKNMFVHKSSSAQSRFL